MSLLGALRPDSGAASTRPPLPCRVTGPLPLIAHSSPVRPPARHWPLSRAPPRPDVAETARMRRLRLGVTDSGHADRVHVGTEPKNCAGIRLPALHDLLRATARCLSAEYAGNCLQNVARRGGGGGAGRSASTEGAYHPVEQRPSRRVNPATRAG